jgi:hypothetical protein
MHYNFILIPASDEPPFSELRHLHEKRLIKRQVIAELTTQARFGADIASTLSLMAQKGLPPLAAAIGTWLATRAGRKVKIKVGDVEVEASNAEEVKDLLDQAQAFRQGSEPKRIYER